MDDASRWTLKAAVGFAVPVVLAAGFVGSIFVVAATGETPFLVYVLANVVEGLAIAGVAGALLGLLFRHLRPAAIGYLLGITPVVVFAVLYLRLLQR